MNDARRLTLRRESLAELTGDDLVSVAGGAIPPTGAECRTWLSLDDVCAPTLSIAALQCLRTIRDSSCACAGG